MRALFALSALLLTVGCQPEVDATSKAWEWNLPDHIPLPNTPETNPMTAEKAELGRHLFYDFQLSRDGLRSCGICHEPAKGFTDGFVRSVGAAGEVLAANSLSVANVAWRSPLMWREPELNDLETQAQIPLFSTHPVEMGSDPAELEAYIADQDYYATAFPKAFPDADDPYTVNSIISALAVHQRRIVAVDSPFDRHLTGEESLSNSALRGHTLFKSDALNCQACHGGPFFDRPQFGDDSFADTAVFANTGLYNTDGLGGYPDGRQGLYELTAKPEDMGKYRTPSLRNVALTGPWGHDGSFASLESVLRAYARGGRRVESGQYAGDGALNPHRDSRLQGFELTEPQLADLLAFLNALTDSHAISNPDFLDPFCRDSPHDLEGCIAPFTR